MLLGRGRMFNVRTKGVPSLKIFAVFESRLSVLGGGLVECLKAGEKIMWTKCQKKKCHLASNWNSGLDQIPSSVDCIPR